MFVVKELRVLIVGPGSIIFSVQKFGSRNGIDEPAARPSRPKPALVESRAGTVVIV